ncbi:MAG: hypothetical protein LBG80_03170 [Bacteroidales bacterium]|jgi:tetratricopeptide (TPR) repeat protein|nr:hypothetical protein [Bacteroidales bacterium]
MHKKKKCTLLFLFLGSTFITIAQNQEKKNVLDNIQNKIDSCFLVSFSQDSVYEPIENALREGIVKSKSDNLRYYHSYWFSYLLYYKSITYIKNGNEKKAKETIAFAIKELEKIKNKDVEVYSLLALEQSYNFQFVPRQEIIIYMGYINDNLEKAIQMNPENVRANYVNGSYDFYTPKEYGGGRKTESFLLKAIQSEDTEHLYSPTWGKVDAYRLLIQYYLTNDSKEKAKKFFIEAQRLFPDNNMIKQLQKQIDNI